MTETEGSSSTPRNPGWPSALWPTLPFAALVIWIATHHEPWRDEVVPLSIVRRAHSLFDLLEPLRFESHPPLWYLVLWFAYALVRQAWVLKGASLAFAIGSVFLVSRSALPWWFRWIFPFSFFPLYQYSVISRGYGLEMFVLFVFCTLYPRRQERPIAIALSLAALANTEAFGFIMAAGAGAMLVLEALQRELDWRRVLSGRWGPPALAIFVLGMFLALAIAFPDSTHRDATVRELDIWRLASVIGAAVLQPARHLESICFLPMPSLWLWAYFVYLTRRPPLLCYAFVGFVGMGAFFNLYPYLAAPWRTGNAMLLLVSVAWLDAALPPSARVTGATFRLAYTWLGRVLAAAVLIVLAGQVILAAGAVGNDVRYQHSASRALAELLRSDPRCKNAVVVGEPDTRVLSLPYYAEHPIYLAREGVYRSWPVFAPPRRVAYSLGELLRTTQELRRECRCPVVVVMGWDLQESGTHVSFGGTPYEETFSVTPDQRRAFLDSAILIGSLRLPTLTDENFDVYLIQ